MMKTRLLTAFRLCGEIDIDGDNDEYGSEGDNGEHYGRGRGEGEGDESM